MTELKQTSKYLVRVRVCGDGHAHPEGGGGTFSVIFLCLVCKSIMKSLKGPYPLAQHVHLLKRILRKQPGTFKKIGVKEVCHSVVYNNEK